jgi:CO dehydrogenase maturation factor
MVEYHHQKTQLIAIAGKGGTGKSALTALMTKTLVRYGNLRILVIDADPTMGLCEVLGVKAIKTLEDIRNEIIRVAGTGKDEEKTLLVNMLDYRIFEALVEQSGFALLAMGEPQDAGCFCPANTLLRKSIESLSNSFDVVLIDCEAGLEQLTRKVVGNIGTLVIMSDVSMRGAHTAMTIKKAAYKFTKARSIGMIVNRVKDGQESIENFCRETGIALLGWMPEDSRITEWDRVGKPIYDLPSDSPSVAAVRRIVEKMKLAH